MPAAYAHYTFGKKVFLALPEGIRQAVAASPQTKRLFALGLQGPDPFFFYRPFYPNRVLGLAGKIHRGTAADFSRPLRMSRRQKSLLATCWGSAAILCWTALAIPISPGGLRKPRRQARRLPTTRSKASSIAF